MRCTNICGNGHDAIVGEGKNRHCRECKAERNAARRRAVPAGASWSDKSKQGDRGGRLDTYCRSEILKARGYV